MITPHEEYANLAAEIGVPRLFFKREDLHPYRSHKGRSIPVMMDHYMQKGIFHFAISSSGNAAIAAAMYAKEKNIELDVYVGKKINTKKLYALQDLCTGNIRLHQVERPLQTMTQSGIAPLRQSNDDTAMIGYRDLAQELLSIPDLKSIFIPSSSGTLAQALATELPNTHIFIVQTTGCHPIAEAFGALVDKTEESIADAIVDKTALRTEAIKKVVHDAYIVDNDQIKSAQSVAKKYTDLSLSPNSAVALAGLMNAVYTGESLTGTAVCIITGN